MTLDPQMNDAVPRVSQEGWEFANRGLIRKMLCEFSHEHIIEPVPVSGEECDGKAPEFELRIADSSVRYRFRARRFRLDHMDIDAQSVRRYENDRQRELDALDFVIELRDALDISESLFPVYLEEISSTLYSRACWFDRGARDSYQLVRVGYQPIESSMIEGHPVFIANSGRIGFDLEDYHAYAPETEARLTTVWVAVSRERAVFTGIPELEYDSFIRSELGCATVSAFREVLSAQGRAADDYLFMPVHPWQWKEKITRGLAADLFRGDIVYLGRSDDLYQPQQSIRTLYNVTSPHRCYVKLALSILNMGFTRGLSPDYMARTPSVNHGIAELVHGDSYFREKGFRVLREVAAIGYRARYYDGAVETHSPYRKMLSALWRESPVPFIGDDTRLMTMAALLHVDAEGVPVVAALIRASGLTAEAWIREYLDTYLSPLLHAFFEYDLVFMPHGENIILALEEHRPVSAFMKDIGEEAAILNGEKRLSPEMSELAVTLGDEMKINYIFLDIFDCFFRFLVPLLDESTELNEEKFWYLVAGCIRNYQRRHPHLEEKFQRYDLFKDDFVRTCLNRIQLNNNRQMINLDDREKNLRFSGTLENPIAGYRRQFFGTESSGRQAV